MKSVEALLCFEQSQCAWLPLSEQRGRSPAYLLWIWGLWLMTQNLYWWQVTSQNGKNLLPSFNTGMKQGGLQTTIDPLSYSVFLNCIGLNPHISRSWMAMLAMPTLISAEQEIHLLFPHLPKPSWVPLHRSHAQCPPRQGWLWGRQLPCCSFPAAASLLPGKQLQCSHQPEWPPQQAVQMHPWCAGEAEHQMQGAYWQVTGLQTSTLVGVWQQDQTCVRYSDKLGSICCHTGSWLWHCHLLQEIRTSHTHLHRSYGPTVPVGFSSEVFHWSQMA